MMDDDGLPEALPPVCATCGRTLARVDHYAIEHFILKGMVYRDLEVNDGGATGGPGIASEIQLRCAYCGTQLDLLAKEFFYQRWWRVLMGGNAASALNLDDPRHDANVVPCDDDPSS